MNVKSVEKENGNAKIVLEIDAATFQSGLNKAYLKNRKHIQVPGFRKGKAPRKVIEGMYGAAVFYEDAVNEIFPDAYGEALQAEKLQAVGLPSVSDMDVAEDGTLVLTVETTLYPEVTLGQYKGLEVPKAEVSVTDEQVDAEIDRLAERNARISTVERPAEMGDTVVLDFEGFQDGKAFEGGKAENYTLKLGSHQFIPGFEEALVGAAAGGEQEVHVTFPENYGSKDLAGKPAVFQCKIHEVKETILPEKDDEFAKDVSEFDTLQALKDDVRARFLKEREDAARKEFENTAVTMAAANMTCEIPDCMIDEQVDKHMEQFAYQLQSSGMKLEDYARMMGGDLGGLRQNMRPMAETTVRSNILLSQVIEDEKLETTDEAVAEEYEKLAQQYQMEVDKVKAALPEESLRSDLLVRQAVALIADSAIPVAPKAPEENAEAETEQKPKKRTAKKKAEEAPDAAEESAETPAPKKRAPRKKAEPQDGDAPKTEE
ncbi:MAG: trigger factor [Oscillospiraceae bacterium]|nr:trigger factor [Oscillospiraceae bacterium]